MAAGDSKIFNEFALKLAKAKYNLAVDDFAISFIATAYGSVNANSSNPDITDYTPLTGGNFVAAVALTSLAITRVVADIKFDFADLATIAKSAGNPATIKTALIKHTASGDLYKAIDLTADGTTSIDVINNDFDYTVNAAGSFTQTVA